MLYRRVDIRRIEIARLDLVDQLERVWCRRNAVARLSARQSSERSAGRLRLPAERLLQCQLFVSRGLGLPRSASRIPDRRRPLRREPPGQPLAHWQCSKPSHVSETGTLLARVRSNVRELHTNPESGRARSAAPHFTHVTREVDCS
jgi:hypothetical protein